MDLVGLHRYELYYTSGALLYKVAVNLLTGAVETQQSDHTGCTDIKSLELVEGFAVLLCNEDLIVYSR